MATEAGIANAALQLIKVSRRIASLTENTKISNTIEEVFTEVRDQLLEMHKWNFAVKRVQLARLSTTPVSEWDHEYNLPSDFIRFISIRAGSDGLGDVDYNLEDGKILTDSATLYLRYVSRVTDPNLMTPLFRAAFSMQLASRLAVALANSSTLQDKLEKRFDKISLPQAKSADALQDMAEGLPESSWVTARYGADYGIDPAQP